MLLICGFLNQGAVASCLAFTYAYMDTAFGLPTSAIGLISAIGMALAVVAALNSSRLARPHSVAAARPWRWHRWRWRSIC